MNEETKAMLDEILPISEEQLEGVAGGGMTAGDREKFDKYIKACKLKGYTLSDTLEELQLMYPNSHDKIYFEWWTDYICENW